MVNCVSSQHLAIEISEVWQTNTHIILKVNDKYRHITKQNHKTFPFGQKFSTLVGGWFVTAHFQMKPNVTCAYECVCVCVQVRDYHLSCDPLPMIFVTWKLIQFSKLRVPWKWHIKYDVLSTYGSRRIAYSISIFHFHFDLGLLSSIWNDSDNEGPRFFAL